MIKKEGLQIGKKTYHYIQYLNEKLILNSEFGLTVVLKIF